MTQFNCKSDSNESFMNKCFLLSSFIAAVVFEVIQEETRVQSPNFLLELCETKGNQPALFCHKTYFRDIWKLKIIPPPPLLCTRRTLQQYKKHTLDLLHQRSFKPSSGAANFHDIQLKIFCLPMQFPFINKILGIVVPKTLWKI